MILSQKTFRNGFLLLIVAILFAASAEFLQHRFLSDASETIYKSEKKLADLNSQMASALEELKKLQTEDEYHNFFLHSGFEKLGFSFYIARNNKLIYWSDNEPVVAANKIFTNGDGKILSLPNGDFQTFSIQKGKLKYAGLILLRHNYDYQNKYLINDFNPALNLPASISVSNQKGINFHLPNGEPVFQLTYDSNFDKDSKVLQILYLFALFLSVIAFHLIIRDAFRRSILFSVVLLGLTLVFRTALLIYKIPDELYKLPIFNPQLYASSFYFNSLGDLLINSLFFLLIAINLYDVVEKKRLHFFVKTILVVIVFIIGYTFHLLITGIILNSQISFDVNSPLEMSRFSIWAFVGIAILIITFLFFVASLIKYFSGHKIYTGQAWIAIALCSVYASVNLNELNKFKEHEDRKLLAQKISARQDHVAEYLIDEVKKKLESDTSVVKLSNKNNDIADYITQKYLNGYLARFEIEIYSYSEKDSLLKKDLPSLDYLRKLAVKGKYTSGKDLYFLNNDNGTYTYISFIHPNQSDKSSSTIVILLTARFLQTKEGFPELFISGNSGDNVLPAEYSIARYSDNSLIYEYGSFTYSLRDKDFVNTNDEFTFVDSHDYTHLVYKLNANSIIVVSKPKETIFTLLTLFSWMFGFIGICSFIIFILSFIVFSDQKFSWNLTRRIQVSVVLVVVLSFILVGTGTVIYIDKKYQNDERKSISDQVNALWFLITEQAVPVLNVNNTDGLSDLLSRIVNSTNIDFNLFDAGGELLFSSQPKIYDQNIISRRMNPEAYFEIKQNQLTQYIHPESAGNLNFISAYAPVTDRNGVVKAYLSLPYFEKQNELNREVTGFLSALLNIYVFLLAIAVLVTVIISSRITKPLLLIQEKMSNVRLGSINEKIEYARKDEIGQLVHEYNRMLEELAISADKLARSEREMAWREMAKQVAHEIKNPLTPMKLSVQHLQRTLQHQNEKDREFVNRISDTLIQQIDTLSNIATAFSDFAKMPQASPALLNTDDVLLPLVDLYREIPELTITVKGNGEKVLADKDYLNRVFSNILKNALQSIPDDRKGEITIDSIKTSNDIQITISDNGIGIPDNKKVLIFVPNFTTKSSGMGLGLAMAKDLIDQSGGTITFISEDGKGSSFVVSLPIVA